MNLLTGLRNDAISDVTLHAYMLEVGPLDSSWAIFNRSLF